MFMFRADSEDNCDKDRKRVMSEILGACLQARHSEVMRAYDLPEDFFSPTTLTGEIVDDSPMRSNASPRQGADRSGPLRSAGGAGYPARMGPAARKP